MGNNDDEAKIGGIKGTQASSAIKRTAEVEQVQRTEKTAAVDKISGVGLSSNRKKTTMMTAAEREELFKLIEEEAKSLLGDAPDSQREAVTESVKMAIDAGILDEEEDKLN
jgi:hypothetical protein